MAFHASILALAAFANGLAIPQSTGNSNIPPFAQSTTINYYQGVATPAGTSVTRLITNNKIPATDPSSTCGMPVGSGTINASHCQVFHTAAVGISGESAGSCSLTLWIGSENCSGGEKKVIRVGNGATETCISTGVLDGGEFEKASGVWACG